MRHLKLPAFSCFLLILTLSGCTHRPTPFEQGPYLVDSGGRPVSALYAGTSLEAGASGMDARGSY